MADASPSTGAPERAPGRPRDPRSDAAILDAARALLEERSLATLTMEAVAARAGVAKTTLYRRYRSREELALAVLAQMAGDQVPVPDLGDTRAELVHAVADTARTMTDTVAGRTIRSLVAALGDDDELAHAFRERLVRLRREELRRVVERGVERGDLRDGPQLALVSELIVGPLFWRLLMTGDALDDAFAAELVDAVLAGLGTRDPA